jgi:kynurenine formamidase
MVVDLTHNVEPSMQAYPGDPPIFSKDQSITVEEHGFSIQVLHIGTHAGTHIDAPSHCVTGAPATHEVDLSALVGPALVVNVTGLNPREEITLAHLEKFQDQLSSGQSRIVLFHTGWSQYWKTPKYIEHPYLTTEVVRKLLDLGVRVIGIDTLSVDRTASDGELGIVTDSFPVHHAVLGAGSYLVENLNNLAAIQNGSFVVSFFPLKIVGGDGSPIRAVAWKAGLH